MQQSACDVENVNEGNRGHNRVNVAGGGRRRRGRAALRWRLLTPRMSPFPPSRLSLSALFLSSSASRGPVHALARSLSRTFEGSANSGTKPGRGRGGREEAGRTRAEKTNKQGREEEARLRGWRPMQATKLRDEPSRWIDRLIFSILDGPASRKETAKQPPCNSMIFSAQ